MARIHPALRVLLIAAAAAALGFPVLSIQGQGGGARLTSGALGFGLGVLVAGYAFLGLRWLYRSRRTAIENAWELCSRPFRQRIFAFLAVGLLMALVLLWPYVMPRKYVNLALETFIYMTLAVGLNVVVGYAGLLVLGYAGFWAIGAYTFSILALRFGVSMWLSLPLAGLAGMAAGLLLGLPSLRLRGDYLAIVTLGFGEIVYYLLKTEADLTGGEMGLPNMKTSGSIQDHTAIPGFGPLTTKEHYYWVALVLLALTIYVVFRIERSRVGRALVAMRDDETAARCMGINTTRLKLSAFAFSAMWAGLAGVPWAAKNGFINPGYFKFMDSVFILAMVVLGGMGSIPGAMLGAVLVYAGPALLREALPEFQEYRLLIFGALMVLLMVFRPQGLLGASRVRVRLGREESS